jgi:Zn-dependent M16 (insulinase) family peptidase
MQMLLEDKAGEEASLIPAGHAVVNGRLRAKLDEASWVNEQMGGLDYLFFLRNLVNEVKNDWPSVLAKLEAVRRLLVNRAALKCSVTLDAESWATFQPQLTAFVDSLPAITAPRIEWKPQVNLTPEGWTIPAKVNYVAQGANLYQLGYKLHGSISVITHYLRTTWLWNSIREQGGAYGGFCSFDNRNGVFSFISYRDPNLLDTLKNYAHSSEFLRELQLDQADLTRSIIGTFSNMDRYQLPDARGYSAFVRHLIGYTDDMRRQYRLEVLHTTATEFKAFAEVLELVNQHGVVTVLGSAEAIKAANEELEPPLVIQKAL